MASYVCVSGSTSLELCGLNITRLATTTMIGILTWHAQETPGVISNYLLIEFFLFLNIFHLITILWILDIFSPDSLKIIWTVQLHRYLGWTSLLPSQSWSFKDLQVSEKNCNKDFRVGLIKECIIGWEPVSIVHYNRPRSSIKQAITNLEATYTMHLE